VHVALRQLEELSGCPRNARAGRAPLHHWIRQLPGRQRAAALALSLHGNERLEHLL